MSREELDRIVRLERTLERVRKVDISGDILTYAPAVLNPFPLASSGNNAGFFPQSRSVALLAFNVSVYVNTTNSGVAYWTIALLNDAGATLASVDTSALSSNTWTRLTDTSLTQPASTNTSYTLRLTATGSPGSIFITPEVIVG